MHATLWTSKHLENNKRNETSSLNCAALTSAARTETKPRVPRAPCCSKPRRPTNEAQIAQLLHLFVFHSSAAISASRFVFPVSIKMRTRRLRCTSCFQGSPSLTGHNSNFFAVSTHATQSLLIFSALYFSGSLGLKTKLDNASSVALNERK